MNSEHSKRELRAPTTSWIDLQDRCVRRSSSSTLSPLIEEKTTEVEEARKVELKRSFSGGRAKRLFRLSYLSLEGVLLLICLTASLLILPLILPPLPPPPLMLLLIPIAILLLLIVLAFMPSHATNFTCV